MNWNSSISNPVLPENQRKAHAKVPKLQKHLGYIAHVEGTKVIYEPVTIVSSKRLVTYQHGRHLTWKQGNIKIRLTFS